MAERAVLTGMQIDPYGRVQALSGDRVVPIENVKTGEWKKTSKGFGVKSEISVEKGSPIFFDPELSLQNSDYVYGIDTNSVRISERLIHVSCLTCATQAIPGQHHPGTIQQIMAIDFEDDEVNAERVGWVFAVEAILRSGTPPGARITLCTDHDLESHATINRREKPLVRDYFLPPNFHLMYAGDKGSTVQNKVVKAAEKGARRVIDCLRGATPPGQMILERLRTRQSMIGFRRWHNSGNAQVFFPEDG